MMSTSKLQIAGWHTIERLLSSDASFLQPVIGVSNCAIAFDFELQNLSVAIPVDSSDLPALLPKALTMKIQIIDGSSKLVVGCNSRELFRSFYDFLIEVIELVFEGSSTPKEAVDEAWSKWGQLIEKESSLSKDKQIGLIGELWLLQRIASLHGWIYALDSWHKTALSEHDFCLPNVDIEVKTTTNENRTHMIGSLTQLQPSNGRELYLLSIQLTSASDIAVKSFSLATMVNSIIDEVDKEPNTLEIFIERLTKAGWQASHMRFYDSRFIFRSRTRFVFVDDNCPRMVESTLSGISQELRSRIGSVAYRVDVTGLGFEDGEHLFEKVLSA